MKRKGFTLIELLAVIVVLAIIALIAVPLVLNTIEQAKKGAASSSAYSYVSALETTLATYMLKNEGASYETGKHTVSELQNDLKVEVKGEAPSEGNFCIGENGTITKASLKINGYVISYEGKEATTTDLEEIEDITCETVSQVAYKCIRATTLHTETCTQTDSTYYCSGAGYTTSGSKGTSTITYGNLGTSGTLTSGDAFTCDVNGDGNFNEATERFYYVSDLYNTTTKTFDTNYAVLVYYNNTTSGVANNTSASVIAYDSSNKNYQGPVTAITNLPTTIQWSNVSLASTSRAILTQTGTTSTTGGTLSNESNPFSYEEYAARLLTAQEINSACGITFGSTGELDSCNYLMENTKYSSSSMGTYGYWLETPDASDSSSVWYVSGDYRFVGGCDADNASEYGVRPAIEILKSEISY